MFLCCLLPVKAVLWCGVVWQLQQAKRAFAVQARGPACERYLEQLEQECEQLWKNGRQMCEEISLTGNHCVNEVSQLQ